VGKNILDCYIKITIFNYLGCLFYHREHQVITQSPQSAIYGPFNFILLCVLCAFFENFVVNI